MKTVVILSTSLHIGGVMKTEVPLVNALVRQGYDVTVLTLTDEWDLKDELDPAVKLVHKPFKRHLGNRIPYIRYVYYDIGMWEKRASAKTLYRYYLGGTNFDVEIAYSSGMCVKIISGSENRNAVRLAWVHSDFSGDRHFLDYFSPVRKAYEVYSGFDKVVCVSKRAERSFIEAIGDTGNLTTIYSIIPVEEIRRRSLEPADTELPEAKLRLVQVARLDDKVKGQSRLIEAVLRLRAEGADISLTIIGGGIDEDSLRQKIRDAGASDFILMTGSLQNPYPYIRQAELSVCASYHEGFNLTVAESLILGTPVLSTACYGPEEILGYGKYGILTENSAEGLYNGLKSVLDDPGTLDKYRQSSVLEDKFFDEGESLRRITALFGKEKA